MEDNGFNYGCMITVLIANVTLGAVSTNYLLMVWFAKDIPWYGDMIIGLAGGQLIIPAAIITWLLRSFGVL